MSHLLRPETAIAAFIVCGVVTLQSVSRGDERRELERDFQDVVKPFLKTYCTGCHGMKKPQAKFDLSPYTSLESVAGDMGHWKLVLQKLRDKEMPTKEAKRFPVGCTRRSELFVVTDLAIPFEAGYA